MEIDDRWVKEGRSGRAGSIDRTNLASPLCPCSLVDLRIEISSIARFFSFFLTVACIIDGVRNLKNIIGGIAATLSVGSLPLIEAAPITPGNLVIYRVGTGSRARATRSSSMNTRRPGRSCNRSRCRQPVTEPSSSRQVTQMAKGRYPSRPTAPGLLLQVITPPFR